MNPGRCEKIPPHHLLNTLFIHHSSAFHVDGVAAISHPSHWLISEKKLSVFVPSLEHRAVDFYLHSTSSNHKQSCTSALHHQRYLLVDAHLHVDFQGKAVLPSQVPDVSFHKFFELVVEGFDHFLLPPLDWVAIAKKLGPSQVLEKIGAPPSTDP